MYKASTLLVLSALSACQPSPPPDSAIPVAENSPMEINLPHGIDAPPPVPADNPMTLAKVELGKQLFFDARLSSDGTVSCATCHNPVMGFTDGRPTSMGTKAQVGGRSAPTIINLAYAPNGVFWDGRAASLEEQSKGPIANPIEMSNTHDAAIGTLNGIPGYRQQFQAVFGSPEITLDNTAKAIAAFERTIISGNSPWDRFLKGDETALSESAKRGWEIYKGKANCLPCHAGFNLTDNGYRNLGVGLDKPDPDLGRFLVTNNEEDRGRFKTPTLREITYTGPYMHDGRFQTLEEVIDFYDRGGIKNPQLDPEMRPLNLTAAEKADLLALLKSFNGEGWKVTPPVSLPPSPKPGS